MTKRKILLPVFAMTMSSTISGFVLTLNKSLLDNVSVLQLTTLRFTVALILVVSLIRFKPVKISTKNFFLIALKSIFNIFQFLLFFFALQRLNGSTASVLLAITPLVIYFGAVRYLHEKARRRVLIGLILALSGAIIVSISSGESESLSTDTIGLVAIATSIVLDAISTLMSKNIVKKVPPKVINKSNFAFMALGFWIITAIRGDWPTDIPNESWWLIITSGVGLAMSFQLYYFALKRVDAKDIGMISYVTPMVAVLGAIIFLGEQPTIGFWVGAGLIITGIMSAELNLQVKKHRHRHMVFLRHH